MSLVNCLFALPLTLSPACLFPFYSMDINPNLLLFVPILITIIIPLKPVHLKHLHLLLLTVAINRICQLRKHHTYIIIS